ncbi:MAG: NADH-quinone oxidoreductase subunit L, partial [Campylobacterota bacterium]
NRIADLGLLIGLFLIFWSTGSLQYKEVFASVGGLDTHIIYWIGIFLFIGAMGKSAQFPLHTWLADAMEGPTPVSALIHAATMVTAGVYLVIRAFPIYEAIPDVGYMIAVVGAFVAMFAASMALVNRDLKRIIAYSTLSQLGYMFVAAGLGAYWIALFHLAAHAFFKALLFLGAGNVMHAMNDELDIKKMGALYKVMKPTAILMIIASVALAGIWPLAGFFSKDKILEVAFNENSYILWSVLWITAGLTAFYSFRLIMYVFFGKDNHTSWGAHPHEMPKFVIYSMAPLAVLAIVFGWFAGWFEGYTTSMLPEYIFSDATHHMVPILIALTLAVAIGGIAVAVLKYRNEPKPTNTKNPLYQVLINQYYIPVIYEKYLTKPFAKLSEFAWKIDMKIVDATVDGIANTIYGAGESARGLQTGNLSKMLRLMAAGVAALLVAAVIYSTL